ncbi:MAG: uroporphyrinogen decarboxylase family protein [bacterium]
MNSRERVLAAIAHRTPDRVPITFDAEKEVIASLQQHFGVASRDAVWDALHVDTRLVGADHHDPRIRTEGDVSYDFWGIGSKEQAYTGGTYSEYCVYPLANRETVAEIEAYDWPTPDELSFETLRAVRAATPDKAIIAHITHAPFFKATHMRGMEAFMTDLALQPELATAIIGRIMGYLIPALERLCREARDDFDIYYIADDFCTALGPLLSPAMFRQHIKPYLAQMAGIVHRHGKKFLLHTCGAVRPLLADVIDAGVDILEPIQTSAAGMAVEGLKRDFGDRLTFYGSIDLITVLSRGSPADVRAEVLKNFRILGANGGFIVGPGHTYIQPDVPLANILAMYETAWRECTYA